MLSIEDLHNISYNFINVIRFAFFNAFLFAMETILSFKKC